MFNCLIAIARRSFFEYSLPIAQSLEDNNEENAFGGKDSNNQPLPSATYYYVIDLENGDDILKGIVTIVR